MDNKTEHNPVLKNIPPEDRKKFKEDCYNSEQYFYENYIKKLPGGEKLPEYSPEAFAEYKKQAEVQRNLHNIKLRSLDGFKLNYFQAEEVYDKLPDFMKVKTLN